MIEQFYLAYRWTLTGPTNPIRVDLGVMATKEYPTIPKAPGLEIYPRQNIFGRIKKYMVYSKEFLCL